MNNCENLNNEPIYAIASEGLAWVGEDAEQKDITPLLDYVMEHVPEAPNDAAAPFKMQIANLGYDNFLGRLGIGRVYEGTVKARSRCYCQTSNEGQVQRKGKSYWNP